MRSRSLSAVATAALFGLTIAAAPSAPVEDARQPAEEVVDTALTAAGICDALDARACLLPFPNDAFTVLDATTDTGRRVDMSPLATPRNLAGKPVDTTEWNRNDGFSPGSPVLTVVPDLDLALTYGLDPDPETGVGAAAYPNVDPFATRDLDPDALIEDPALSLAEDSPIVLLDADTGERHPFFADLDEHPETIESGADRTLIVRPLVNLAEGHRYIVALRDLRRADGSEIAPTAAFAALRDALAEPPTKGKKSCDDHPGKGKGKVNGKGCVSDGGRVDFPAPADIDPADRDSRYEDIFSRLGAAGVDPTELYLAWDFHVASERNLAGRALAIRDQAFALLGDTDLADGTIQGTSPAFAITDVVDEESEGYWMREVHGTVTVPNFMTSPQDSDEATAGSAYREAPSQLRDQDPLVGPGIALSGEAPTVAPQSRLYYGEPAPGPMATPVQNPAVTTTEAEFVCKFRTDLRAPKAAGDPSGDLVAARPTLYGHGLLGTRGEAEGGSTGDLRRGGHAMCGVDWIGMAFEDLTNVGLILNDVSFFPSLADRAQQGFLNFLYVGRALIHPAGLSQDAAFRDANGDTYLDTRELFYDGNSQGGIMGGALTALSPDFTKSVLGVPGMNYSTLLNRSVDWEGEYLPWSAPAALEDPSDPDPEDAVPAYASFLYQQYPDKVDQQIGFALMQMLWDRAEANGYAHHMTTDPYPNTPPHQVLLEVALGDYQVTNHAAEVEARTIGADFLGSAIAPGRHWDRPFVAGLRDAPFGLTDFTTPEDGSPQYAASGSGIVYWDSGNPLPFNANVHPADLGEDPHSDPRKDDRALTMKRWFYETGMIIDVLDGQPYFNQKCRHPEHNPSPTC